MAALQSIRSKGTILMIVLGLVLFLFIAESFFQSIQTTSNISKQQIGEVNGETLSAQEFQTLVEEYTEAFKFMRGGATLSDDEQAQLQDQVWQTYVNNQLIAEQAEKLGLKVTEEEIQNVLREGTNNLLLQTPFRNQQTGKFDLAGLQQFLTEYKKMQNSPEQAAAAEQYASLYKYWLFIEKTLRSSLLGEKFQSLLGKSILSNSVLAKAAFDDTNDQITAQVAAIPFTAIADKGIEVTEEDLKKAYKEKKELFKQYVETRDIEYIDVAVSASPEDRAALDKEMADVYQKLQAGEAVENVVRASSSEIPYAGVAFTRNAYPADIASVLDSLAPGALKAPFYSVTDNTLNIVKLISKTQAPDSVEYAQIQVPGSSVEAARATADSIAKALNAGADFAEVAKKYGQTGDKTWLTSAAFEGANIDGETAKFLNTLTATPAGGVANIALAQGNIVVKVFAQRNLVTKYNAAVIKRPVNFSKETYAKAFNNFSRFVAANTTLEAIRANATKSGYVVNNRADLSSSEHTVANVRGTKDALRWIFDAEAGSVSPLYEVGNGDHLLLVAVTKIHPEGYRSFDDVKEMLKQMVLNDKKAEKVMGELKGNDAFAKASAYAGATTDSVQGITFAAAPFIQATGAPEPIIAGAAAKTKVGAVSGPLKGNAGVYVLRVDARTKSATPFDAKAQEQALIQQSLRSVGGFMQDLYLKAKVVDKRYLFF